MKLYASVDGKGDEISEVVAFVGGDWQHWAILRSGDRLRPFPLEDLRIKTEGEFNHQATLRKMAEEGY